MTGRHRVRAVYVSHDGTRTATRLDCGVVMICDYTSRDNPTMEKAVGELDPRGWHQISG